MIPEQVRCDSCGAAIEGAAIGEVGEPPRMWHPWCWNSRERAVSYPGPAINPPPSDSQWSDL